eukprot:scpid74503/ scgid27760/ 
MLGVVVCREVFQDAHGLSHTLLRKLQEDAEHLLTTPQSSKSKGKPPPNILPTAVADNVVQFIKNYASRYGMPQPAAPRGRAAKAPTYLPASCTKKEIHCLYCDSEGAHPISLTTFKRLWKANSNTPYIIICIMKQRSDVCARCERLRENVRHAKTEETNRLAMEQLSAHMQEADDERQYYNKSISDATGELSQTTDTDTQASSTHITFDFAQQLELPQHTRQEQCHRPRRGRGHGRGLITNYNAEVN